MSRFQQLMQRVAYYLFPIRREEAYGDKRGIVRHEWDSKQLRWYDIPKTTNPTTPLKYSRKYSR